MAKRERIVLSRWRGGCAPVALFGRSTTVHVFGECSCLDAPWRRPLTSSQLDGVHGGGIGTSPSVAELELVEAAARALLTGTP